MEISKKLLDFISTSTGGNGIITMVVSVALLLVGFVMLIKVQMRLLTVRLKLQQSLKFRLL